MNTRLYIITLLTILIFSPNCFCNEGSPLLQGEITNGETPIPFATIQIKNTTIGTASDVNGKFFFNELPEGEHILVIKAVGHKTKEIKVDTQNSSLLTIKLNEDVLGLEQIVVTADKNQKKRINASMIVNTITPKVIGQTQSIAISDALNYSTGLRMENNCQNCGANQLRMNGMEGTYSQVLINGRPIFSGLAGVYGLEMIPTNMIQQIEVVKGGGSALYGSNAIAGTVNLITKEPLNNIFEASVQNGFIGINKNSANDLNINLNTAIVSEDKNTGLSLYATHRKRDAFDANEDTFSELSIINNTTFGASFYHRMGYRTKLTMNYFHIDEKRRGGDMLDVPEHEANIAEAAKHKINTGSIELSRFVGENNGQISLYASAQNINRGTYYGARLYPDDFNFILPLNNPQQLSQGTPDNSAYGSTQDLSYSFGVQYKNTIGKHSIISGIENNGGNLFDEKLGYTDASNVYNDNLTISDQRMNIWGIFTQYDYTLNNVTLSAGFRLDNYNIVNEAQGNNKLSNSVFSPRLNVLYKALENLQLRASYSQGYRAPQIFDEDLHILVAGERKVEHRNSENLKQETSNSWMLSMDYHSCIGSSEFEILAEGFYTTLQDPFTQEIGSSNSEGTTIYTRVNSDDPLKVKGVNVEVKYFPNRKWNLNMGFTTQISSYDADIEHTANIITDKLLRTPNNYGFFAFNFDPFKNFTFSLNGTYTGKMEVAYFGNTLNDPDFGELRTTQDFFDLGLKTEYFIKGKKGFDMSIFCAVKNIFNSYQNDFDKGYDRDPGYIYGPGLPTSLYFGVRIGNLLQ